METNQNRSSQPQGKSNQNQFSQGNSNQESRNASQGNSNQESRNASQGNSNQESRNSSQSYSSSQGNRSSQSNASQGSSSSIGGLNMNNLTEQLQKYSTPILNKVNSLTTTQKVVGGALLAAGAGWLAMKPQSRTKVLNNFKRTAANKKLK